MPTTAGPLIVDLEAPLKNRRTEASSAYSINTSSLNYATYASTMYRTIGDAVSLTYKNLYSNYQTSSNATYATWTSSTSTTINYYATYHPLTVKYGSGISEVPLSERLKEMIRSNMAPVVHAKRFDIKHPEDVREMRARESLQIVIGEEAYQRFLRRGFIPVKAKSGRTYTVYRGHGLTGVYENGELIQRLCVDLSGGFAPTDSLLARYFMILHDEQGFLAKCNVQSVSKKIKAVPQQSNLRLIDQFSKLKNQHPKTNANHLSDLRVRVA